MEKYKSWEDVPDHLKTKTGLSELGLKPAKGQEPAAIKTHWHYKIPDYSLYDISQAVPKRQMTEAQKAALEQARVKAMTTTCCNRYTGVINWREKGNMCLSCWLNWQEEQHQAMLTEAREEAEAWAREVLADSRAIILDTETTGLEGEIVEIAIIDMAGNTILNQLIKPVHSIPEAASNIHGISDETVKDAPTFPEVYEVIRPILENASRVVIYNAGFDDGRLWSDCYDHKLEKLNYKSECAMEWHAQWYGEYSEYHGSFKWQRLNGGHRALGDCLACLDRLKSMAKEGEAAQRTK